MDKKIGNCCKVMQSAINMTSPAKSLFNISEGNDMLYLSVGYIVTNDGKIGWFDQAVTYCPFCGYGVVSE